MQQVNLYTDAFKPQKITLPLEHIVLLTALSILIVIAATFWVNASLAQDEQRVHKEQQRIEKMSNQLMKLEEKAKLLRQDDSLVAANKRLSAKLEARRQMINVLDSVVVKDDEGFSNLLLSLARQKTDGLWLTGIHVGASGQDMTIEGTTLNAKAVPAYLQNLRNESGFIGRTFTLFNLDADPKKPSRLDFSLRSQVSRSNDGLVLEEMNAMTLNKDLKRQAVKQQIESARELMP